MLWYADLGEIDPCVPWRTDMKAYTEGTPKIVMSFGLVPVGRYLPSMPGPILGADQKVCNFDFGVAARVLKKLTYMGYDLGDEGVALSRAFMRVIPWGDCDPEN